MASSPRYVVSARKEVKLVLTLAGNFYSIVNDYEKPARIFFAQGCEVQEEIQSDAA